MTGTQEEVRNIVLLGATGSIGTTAARVIEHLNRREEGTRFRLCGLAAERSWEKLRDMAARFNCHNLALADTDAARRLKSELPGATVFTGEAAAEELIRATASQTDIVIGAIVGIAGLRASLATLDEGTDLALANKETLVAAGHLVTQTAARTGAAILPVDSEHSAIWQSLQGAGGERQGLADCTPPCNVSNIVHRIILTASGGPLREATAAEIRGATVERVLAHPTWNMGAKVTVDSASLTNKALEIIEAHHLFGLPGEQISTIIHPQSIVHSIVEYLDGSMISQMGVPDMGTPVQYALTSPQRPRGVVERLDLSAHGLLEFYPPDGERFPALQLAYEVMRDDAGTSGAVFNAANEEAVQAFLRGEIRFGDITALTAESLERVESHPVTSLDEIFEADRRAREFVRGRIRKGIATF